MLRVGLLEEGVSRCPIASGASGTGVTCPGSHSQGGQLPHLSKPDPGISAKAQLLCPACLVIWPLVLSLSPGERLSHPLRTLPPPPRSPGRTSGRPCAL